MTAYTKIKEYIWLVNTIHQAKKLTLVEINNRWLGTQMSEGIPLSRTTFHRHRIAIEEIFGLFINCDKKNGYKYYIGNEYVLSEDSVQNWMRSTLSAGNVLTAMSLTMFLLIMKVAITIIVLCSITSLWEMCLELIYNKKRK